MTIAQRIELRRLGYTKEEIAELAEMEKAPAPDPVPENTETEPAGAEIPEQIAMDLGPETPDVQSQLLAAINNLTAVMQSQKLTHTAQPEIKQETAEDIFNNILKG
ncbi:MAG: hypothetical protein IKY66_07490 [Bacteroidales bacterium]|nr:hypothetical protein [Bacteroidales bacterium]